MDVIGPIFAGFQLAAAVISYVGVGAFASWVLSVWFPFTRNMWQLLIETISLPFSLTDIEKDSLTTLLFFLPVALSGFFKEDRTYMRGTKTPLFGAIGTAIVFTLIVGQQVWTDFQSVVSGMSNRPVLIGIVYGAAIAFGVLATIGLKVILRDGRKRAELRLVELGIDADAAIAEFPPLGLSVEHYLRV